MEFTDILIFTTCLLVYFNSIFCGLVFDDISAVKDNQDLRPSTSWLELFRNDFWGTPIRQERSHKSYRPMTVLTFRLNYWLHGLNVTGYHFVNVSLHSLVSVLFFRFCRRFLTRQGALMSSLYFAVHPIHTEAVTGIVGRAELLSATVSLVIVFAYEHVRILTKYTHWFGLCAIGVLLLVGTLCKEQCITIVAVLFAWEFIDAYRYLLSSRISSRSKNLYDDVTQSSRCHSVGSSHIGKGPHPLLTHIQCFFRVIHLRAALALMSFTVLIMYLRLRIMNSKLPHFTEFDNPAAHAPPLIRRLTHLYLVPLNLWLILFPSGLCADWTLGSVPLIVGWTDFRNVFTLLAFSLLSSVLVVSILPKTDAVRSKTLFMALGLMVFPFLPASNLFFPVGFVIAERTLYVPTFGVSLLFGLGYDYLCKAPLLLQRHDVNRFTKCLISLFQSKRCYCSVTNLLVVLIFFAFGVKTIRRNLDWTNEYALFSSALKVNPKNAKMWNNVGHSLEAHGDYKAALGYFRKAVEVQPNDIGARINVGRTFANLKMLKSAEEAYIGALDYFPKPKKGQTYYARVAPKDLMLFINLANLYLNKTPPQLEDASRLLRRAISLRSDFVDAYQNYGSVLIRQGKFEEAEAAFRRAIGYQDKNPDLYYNLGVVLLETHRVTEGVDYLERALLLRSDHLPSMFALASTLTDNVDPVERLRGKQLLKELTVRDYEPAKVHFALAMLETDFHNFEEAVGHYRKVLQVEPNHRSALFNLALLLRNQLNDVDGAIPLLKRLLEVHPDHVKSHLLMGDILLTEKRQADSAKYFFQRVLDLVPTNIQAKHNLCVVLAELGDLENSERCLTEVIDMAPTDQHARLHLETVRKRLAST